MWPLDSFVMDRQKITSIVLHGTVGYWILLKPYTEKALNKMIKERAHSHDFSFVVISLYVVVK